jgi:hypothetical protein
MTMEETTTPTASCAAIECSQKMSNICAAMAKAQAKIQNAARDAENPYFNSSYASLAGVWDVVRGPLTENELAVFQGHKVRIKPDMTGGEVDVTTMLTHATGEWFRTTVTLPVVPMGRKKRGAEDGDNDADRTPGKITPQAIGSAITYGRRYGLESLAGTAPETEDDDGNSASGKEQVETIPESGTFEDVIESVENQTKKKRDGGTFVVCLVKTGKHGMLECWEREGAQVKPLAGTGQAVTIRAEKTKYGNKLIEVRPVEGSHVESQPAASTTPLDLAEIDPETQVAFPPGIAKARSFMRKALAACKSEKELDALVETTKTSGSAYQSPKVTCLVAEARQSLRVEAVTA